jgi:DNA-binding response OmpR family regulator
VSLSLHLIHPDPFFANFLGEYLKSKDFEVAISENNVEAFSNMMKNPPNLIIMSKDSPFLDAQGFFIKKNTSEKLKGIPTFMIGDFSPQEITWFKSREVYAFLTKKINPIALIERIYLHFKTPVPIPKKQTPMLMDIHAKSDSLIIQLEGNLEADKLVLLNYLIRLFLASKKIKTPRIMFIIPHLYPDNISVENLNLLFSFIRFKELEIDLTKIVVLTRHKDFLAVLHAIPELDKVNRVQSYYDGFRYLVADFDMETKVPLGFIKPGNKYLLDLYDMNGKVILPAMTEITEALLETLSQNGVSTLKYFGTMKLDDIDTSDFDPMKTSVIDYITRDFSPVTTELFDSTVFQEKQNLFFSQVRGQNLLFISLDPSLYDLAQQALGVYFIVQNVKAKENLKPMLEDKHFSIVFVDLTIPQDTVLKILHAIRANASRRKTTVILLAKNISKTDLITFKGYGTDHVILHPFSTEKFYQKVYSAVTIDRGM